LLSCVQAALGGACLNSVGLSHCPFTCDACQQFACEDSRAPWKIGSREGRCDQLANLDSGKIVEYCGASSALSTTCRGTCEHCNS